MGENSASIMVTACWRLHGSLSTIMVYLDTPQPWQQPLGQAQDKGLAGASY